MFEKPFVSVKSAHDLSSQMISMVGSERTKISLALNFAAIRTTVSYLEQVEVLNLQQLCLWYYFYGVPRVQKSFECSRLDVLFLSDLGTLGSHQILGIDLKGKIKTYAPPAEQTEETDYTTKWHTCQIDSNTLFELKGSTGQCRLLKVKSALRRTYQIEARKEAKILRLMPCLVYDREIKSVYVIGGQYHPDQRTPRADLLKVSVYSVGADEWSDNDLPSLTNVCSFSGACILNGVIYVIGKLILNCARAPIERLDTREPEAGWTQIDIPREVGRKPFPGVIALEKTSEIVIFRDSSVYLFDTQSQQLKEEPNRIDFEGHYVGNQVRQAEDGCIYLLKHEKPASAPKLLKWTSGEQKVTLVKEF